jgi:hypothetical protein
MEHTPTPTAIYTFSEVLILGGISRVSFAFEIAELQIVALVVLPLAFVSTLANLAIICFSQSNQSKRNVNIFVVPKGEFHDQGDAKWIVIRGQLRGHNDAPFGRPTSGRPIGRSSGVFGGFSYY